MKNFRLLTLVGATVYIAIGISSPLISLYLQSLGANYAQISLILTSYVATLLLGNYVWGRVSDWLGRRKPLLIGGLLGVSVAYALLSQVPTANAAWLARLLEGASMAAYTTLSLAVMGDSLEAIEALRQSSNEKSGQKGRLMGIYRGLGSLAFSFGALIGGRLADTYSLSLTFKVCATLYAVAGIFAIALIEPRIQTTPFAREQALAPRPQPKPVRRANQLPYLFLGGVVLWTAAHSASTSMWPNYMAQLGYNKTAISSLWGLAAFIEMPAMYIAGTLSDVTGRAVMLAAGGFGIALVNLGYILVATYLPALLGVQVIRGFGFGSYTTSAMTFTAETGGQQARGSNSGLFFTAGSAGQLLGMLLGGNVVQALGFHAMFAICVALALSSASCFLLLRYRSAHPANAPSGA